MDDFESKAHSNHNDLRLSRPGNQRSENGNDDSNHGSDQSLPSSSSEADSNNLKDDVDHATATYFESTDQSFRKRHKRTLQNQKIASSRFRLLCGEIVNNEIVQIAMVVLIIINAIVMGVATFDFVSDEPSMEELFETIDRGFLTIYTVELVMQLIYFGWHVVHDAWLLFDLVIVIVSWGFELNNQMESQFQIIRAFRIFRALRLITRIKVLRHLVAAIGEVIPRMTAITMLLVLVFYIFAVLFTELFKDLELSDSYFSTLDASLFTCYEMMTLEWASVARQVMAHRSWAWIPFLAFVMITGFMVFNLIIAVICDAVSIIDKVAREREARARGIILETPDEQLEYARQRTEVLSERIDFIIKTQKEMQTMVDYLASEVHRIDEKRRKMS
jgi:hypothetical protein